jgi:hypothetical protein
MGELVRRGARRMLDLRPTVVYVGDLLHEAYGDREHPSVPAPRQEDDERDAGSVVDRIRSWPITLEAAAGVTGLVLARALSRPRTGSGAPAG